jgi:hypothetical protein
MSREVTYRNEADVKKRVKKLLDQHNWFWWMPPANGFGKIGVSDFNAFRGGVFLAVETKFGNNKPTHHQKAFLESILAESGFAFVVTDKNMPWLESWLAAFDRAAEKAAKNQPVEPEDGAMMLNALKELTAGIQ